MVMMTEGVHSGSRGPFYYSAKELEKATLAWNHKPILIDHPSLSESGCKPDVLNKQSVGVVLNTKWDGKQRAEAWLDKERLGTIAPEIAKNILNNVITEVSTGLYFDEGGEPGVWNDEPYLASAEDHKPDHLAILPNDVGACSVAKGAGLLQLNKERQQKPEDALKDLYKLKEVTNREIKALLTTNELSHSDIRSSLYSKLNSYYNDMFDGWIEDVFETFFIYYQDGNLYKLGYTVSKDEVSLDGTPEQVVRVTEYRTVAGALVGNSASASNPLEKQIMGKKEKVDALIANKSTQWADGDRETLMAMDEKVLDKLNPVENKEEKKDPPKEEKKEEPAENKKDPTPAPAMNAQQWLISAPPEIRSAVQNAMTIENNEKKNLVDVIAANKSNKFNPDWLMTQELEFLRNIAAIAHNAEEDGGNPPMYLGAGVSDPTFNRTSANKVAEEDSLPPPVMNFDDTAKELKLVG
jgi:hypothetical protein